MNAIDLAEKEGRIKFFPGGSYKYVPSEKTLAKMAEFRKPFDREKALERHSKKLIFKASVHEGLRRVELIENQLAKGNRIIKIQNKRYICH